MSAMSMSKWVLAALIAGALAGASVEAQITPTFTFTNGTVADADEVNTNFALLGNALNRTGGTMTGNLLFSADNTNDIGASGATRPRDLFLGRNAAIGGTLTVTGATTLAAATGTTISLTGDTNQIVLDSDGNAGTISWAPSTARTLTLPDATTTMVGIDITQTLTNKTIAFGSNTVSGTSAQFNTANTDDDFATLAASNTFTNAYNTFNGLRVGGGDANNTIYNAAADIAITADSGQEVFLGQTSKAAGLSVTTATGNVSITGDLTVSGGAGSNVGLLGTAGTWTAAQTFTDNVKALFGTGADASIYYNGTNLVIDPDEVGSGAVAVSGDLTATTLDLSSTLDVTGVATFDSTISADFGNTSVPTYGDSFAMGGYAGTSFPSVGLYGQAGGVLVLGGDPDTSSFNGTIKFLSANRSTSAVNTARFAQIDGRSNGIGATAGGYLQFSTTPDAGSLTANFRVSTDGHIAINATKRLYLDGEGASGHTYIEQTSDDSVSVVVGGVTMLTVNESTTDNVQAEVDLAVSSADLLVDTGQCINLDGQTSASTNDTICATGTRIDVISGGSGGVRLSDGATSWSAISDERLKTELVAFDDAMAKVRTLRARTGRYHTDDPSVRRSFLIAQDVARVLPEAVTADPETGYLDLRYTDVIPLLVASLHELDRRLARLEDSR